MNNITQKRFLGVSDFIDNNGGIEHFRCFAKLYKMIMVTPFGFCVVGSECTWVECCITESYYKISDGYKISLIPANKNDRLYFAREDYSHSDFMQLVKDNCIIVKTRIDQRVEHVKAAEHLYGDAYLIHEGDIIV